MQCSGVCDARPVVCPPKRGMAESMTLLGHPVGEMPLVVSLRVNADHDRSERSPKISPLYQSMAKCDGSRPPFWRYKKPPRHSWFISLRTRKSDCSLNDRSPWIWSYGLPGSKKA